MRMEDFLNQIVHNLYARAQNAGSDKFGSGMVVVDHPLDAEAILRSPQYFEKNFSLLASLGRSRFSANGEDWNKRRNLTQPDYLRAGRTENKDAIYSTYRVALASLSASTGADIQRSLLMASSTIFFRSFGLQLETEPLLQFFDEARAVLKRLQYFSWNMPTAAERSKLVDEATGLIAKFDAQASPMPGFPILLNNIEKEAAQIGDFSALQEIMMNFFAGIETTAATLCWAIDRLGADQRAQDKIYQTIVRENSGDQLLDSFINETMRYFPPIPFVIREVTSDVAVGDMKIPRGSLVLLSVIGVHHHPDFWHEPHIFDSFRTEFIDDTYDRRALIPFLAGPRICGGIKLAKLEVAEGLRAFIRDFKVERTSDQVTFDYGLALRPNSWQHLTIMRR